jgi:uncharacterized protein
MSEARSWTVQVGEQTTSAIFEPATRDDTGIVFVCAHGAGGNMNDGAMLNLSAALRDRGLGVVRFNFLYKEKKSGRPDPMPRLEQTFAAVVQGVRVVEDPEKILIGGRSMGGRAASMMASKEFDCDGLLLFAYPLHPPGQPTKLRDEHLSSIKVPVLCFNGTRDPFCTPDLMEAALKKVTAAWQMHWLTGADHSFHVLKSSGRTDQEVTNEVAQTTSSWLNTL